MSTKTEPGPFDGMARAEPDEPVFTLRAHDPLAPGLVHEWADRRRKAIREAFAREEITEAKRDLELLQCREAEEIAWSMDAWRKGEIAQIAEALEAEAAKPSHGGVTKSEDELAAWEPEEGSRDWLNFQLAAAREKLARVEGALEDIGIYGCGMLNQPAAMNGPEHLWLEKRIHRMEQVARDTLAALREPAAEEGRG